MKNNLFTKKTLSTIYLLLAAIIWGSGFLATQVAIDSNFSELLILFFRFSIGAVIFYIAFRKKLKKFTKQELIYGCSTGAALFVSFYLQTLGLKFTTPSSNAFITATNVIFVPFISLILLKTRIQVKSLISAIICIVGVTALSYSSSLGISFSLGDLLTLFCAVSFALHIVFVGMSAQKVELSKLLFLQIATAAVLSIIMLVTFDIGSVLTANYSVGIWSVIYLGVFSTCICYFLQTSAQKHVPPTNASIILSTEALFGSAFSILLGFEPFQFKLIIGGLLIFFSIVIIEIKFIRKKEIN